jgi:hypothetical protein
MSDKPVLPVPDPLAETQRQIEALSERLTEGMRKKRAEFERFKEETLWRLNALSDRTIENARAEEREIEARLAQDKAEAEEELSVWRDCLSARARDEKLLVALAEEAFRRLLPVPEKNTGGNGGDAV